MQDLQLPRAGGTTGPARPLFPHRYFRAVLARHQMPAAGDHVRAAATAIPAARATGGGKALPTCREAAVLRPANSPVAGNPWGRAPIPMVSPGRPKPRNDS